MRAKNVRQAVESWAGGGAGAAVHLRGRCPLICPATRRVGPRVANKFGHGGVGRVTYSVPIRHAYRPVWVKLYHAVTSRCTSRAR